MAAAPSVGQLVSILRLTAAEREIYFRRAEQLGFRDVRAVVTGAEQRITAAFRATQAMAQQKALAYLRSLANLYQQQRQAGAVQAAAVLRAAGQSNANGLLTPAASASFNLQTALNLATGQF